MRALASLRGTPFVALLALLAAALACDPPTTGALEPEAPDDVAAIQLALTAPPAGVSCVRVVVESTGTSRKATRLLSVSGGQVPTGPITGLPLGPVTITADAFSESCGSVGSSTVPTWASEIVTATLVSGQTPWISLVLRPAGRARVGIDFDTTSRTETEEFSLNGVGPAQRVAVRSNGQVYFTARAAGVVGKLNPSSAAVTVLWRGAGEPVSLAVAESGDLWVATYAGQVMHFNSSGTLVATVPVLGPTLPRQVAVAPNGDAWVAGAVPRLARIQGATVREFPLPGGTGHGKLVVGSDGLVRTTVDLSVVVLDPATGQTQLQTLINPPDELVRASDGSTWTLDVSGRELSRIAPDGSVLATGGFTPSPDANLVALPDSSVVMTQPTAGRLQRSTFADGHFASTVYGVGNAVMPGGIALAPDGRLWVTDYYGDRIFAVRLP
jgi:streptogramin lyase